MKTNGNSLQLFFQHLKAILLLTLSRPGFQISRNLHLLPVSQQPVIIRMAS